MGLLPLPKHFVIQLYNLPLQLFDLLVARDDASLGTLYEPRDALINTHGGKVAQLFPAYL